MDNEKPDKPHEGKMKSPQKKSITEEINGSAFEETLDRLKQACGATSDEELARALGIKGQSVGGARKRGKLPLGWIIDIGKEYVVSLDWLFYNKDSNRPMKGVPSENSIDGIINRLKQACGATSDKELAMALGIKRQAIGNARKRGELPYVWIFAISKKYSISLDWLFHGDLPPLEKDGHKNSENSRPKSNNTVKNKPGKDTQSEKDEARTPSNSILDLDLMVAVISAFEEYASKNNICFKPKRKAKVISGLYDHFFTMGKGFDVVVFKRLMDLIE